MNADRALSRRLILGGLAACAARPALAQGFAGLGTDAAGFDIPVMGTPLRFPADHGPHDRFRIEWWYLTANLRDAAGRDYGIQWTLFRSALAPGDSAGWQSPQVWMGHAALTTQDRHWFAEKLARGGTGQAGVTATPFAAWIDDWQMSGPDLDTLDLHARGDAFAYRLHLTADGPLVLQGQDGYSVKSSDGQASYYYSQPHYQITGQLDLPDGPNGPLAVTGQGWLDREWSSQPLAADQSGWDWFSLRLDDGDKLMAFRLRGGRGHFTSATWIAQDGTATALPDGAITMTPAQFSTVAGRDMPTGWRLTFPARGLDITVTALNTQAWMGTLFAYWEGPVRVTGTHTGRGYLEMTGY